MKIKNYDLVGIANTLDEYSTLKLPQKISYAIFMNLNRLKPYIEAYNESIKKSIESYKDYILKDSNGNVIMENGLPKIDDSHSQDYMNEIWELLNIEIDVDLYTVNNEIFNYDNIDKYDLLSAQDMFRLQNILCSVNQEVQKWKN